MNTTRWLLSHTAPLTGKRVVVTGANSGIGFAAARHFLFLGANVTLACRNEERANEAARKLSAEFPKGAVDVALLDLSRFSSIDAFAADWKTRGETVDIFFHCAGVYYPKEQKTADGLPMTVGVNYHGTVRLAEAMLPFMNGTGKMIFTISLVDRFGRVGGTARSGKEGKDAYYESKLLLSAYVLRRSRQRTENEPEFLSYHPGITATNLLSPSKTAHKPWFSKVGHAFLFVFTHSPDKASLGAVMAGAGDCHNGDCIGPRGLFGISGFPHKTKYCGRVRRLAGK